MSVSETINGVIIRVLDSNDSIKIGWVLKIDPNTRAIYRTCVPWSFGRILAYVIDALTVCKYDNERTSSKGRSTVKSSSLCCVDDTTFSSYGRLVALYTVELIVPQRTRVVCACARRGSPPSRVI